MQDQSQIWVPHNFRLTAQYDGTDGTDGIDENDGKDWIDGINGIDRDI